MASKRNKNQTSSTAGKAQAVWLAGLGAVSIAQKRGTKLLSGLAAEGRDFQARAQRLARDNAKKIGALIERGVALALSKLGVPSKSDIEALSQRMSALSRQLKAAK